MNDTSVLAEKWPIIKICNGQVWESLSTYKSTKLLSTKIDKWKNIRKQKNAGLNKGQKP